MKGSAPPRLSEAWCHFPSGKVWKLSCHWFKHLNVTWWKDVQLVGVPILSSSVPSSLSLSPSSSYLQSVPILPSSVSSSCPQLCPHPCPHPVPVCPAHYPYPCPHQCPYPCPYPVLSLPSSLHHSALSLHSLLSRM